MIILGIDPGIAIVGYAIIEIKQNKKIIHKVGVVTTSKNIKLSSRLLKIYTEIEDIIKTYKPTEISIETLLFAKNKKTAMNVSQARGVILLICGQYRLKIFEYSPLQIKQGITGYGSANKEQIGKMLCLILNLKNPPKPDDAADALAIALCHYNYNQNLSN